MHLKAEEVTILAHTLTQVQELVVQDIDNLSANALSWDNCLLEEQANIDDTSQGADKELYLYFSARRIIVNTDPLDY